MLVQLTSLQNPRLQELRKAARAGRPLPDGTIVAEGPHLLADAAESTWGVQSVFASPAAIERFAPLLHRIRAEVIEVSERALESMGSTETTQGLIVVLRPRPWSWPELLDGAHALLVVLDGIQDPGNAGTIIRSAEAFGASAILLAAGSARISNGKLLRAAAGSLFRLPFLESSPVSEILQRLRSHGLPIYALASDGELSISSAALAARCALAVGNEGAGLSAELLAGATTVRIPTRRVESLNAGVACSIALFEAARQRGLV